jgi:Domain of unknown function (DU1801)
MAEPKTQPTGASVADHIDALPDPRLRADCRTLVALMTRASGAGPVMWGTSIVGFGSYRYLYASGQSGDWPLTGFAARARTLTIYLMDGFEQRAAALDKLGPHACSKSCLYVKTLADLDLAVLEAMVADSVRTMRARWPAPGPAAACASATRSSAKQAAATAPTARKAGAATARARGAAARTGSTSTGSRRTATKPAARMPAAKKPPAVKPPAIKPAMTKPAAKKRTETQRLGTTRRAAKAAAARPARSPRAKPPR